MTNTDLRAAAQTDPKDLAGAIAAGLREHGTTYVEGIGPNAVNVMVKALAIARGYVATSGANLVCWPGFQTTHSQEYGEQTSIRFTVMLA